MTTRLSVAAFLAAFLLFVGMGFAGITADVTAEPTGLRSAASFSTIADRHQRSVAIFREMGRVIQSPRCLNCHPVSNIPTQTDRMRPHQPLVVFGKDGSGAPGLQCSTCHHDGNFEPAGVPGSPHWALAPPEMSWAGKSLGQICRQMRDVRRNGGRSASALVTHMGTDKIVGWAWHPGAKRTPAPGTQHDFGVLAAAWIRDGAQCPR
jgi:hypothetical protein